MTKKSRILIVDDHPAIRSTMADVLIEEGFETEIAQDGEIALNKCSTESFDFVLIDVQMPKLNGVEVFREIKKSNKPLPKFIFFSAYSIPELKKDAEDLGCLAFLEKPIELGKVISLIKNNKNTPVLVYLTNKIQSDQLIELLKRNSFYTISAENIDQTLIQLRQINIRLLIYDSDIPEVEHDGINATIKTLKTNTLCIETNEDETIDCIKEKINHRLKQEQYI